MSTALSSALLSGSIYREHLAGRVGHPERPERYDAVIRALEKSGLTRDLLPVKPRAATEEELLLCHTQKYLQIAKQDVDAGLPSLSTGDTDIGRNSWNVASHAVGGVLNAVDAVISDQARNAFCAVRPPGHHASAGRGMGFCLFNNVAIAARYAQRKHGLGRVMIVDWDVHHGNSTHQWPLYPGTGRADETGEGPGLGTTMNFPFPAGSGRAEILGAVQRFLMP